MPNKILLAIEDIKLATQMRGYDPEKVFTLGECGSLFLLLYELFPGEVKPYGIYPRIHEEGKSWISRDADHILTQYQGNLYDIKGKFNKELDENVEVLRACDNFWEPYLATNNYRHRDSNYNGEEEIQKIVTMLAEKGYDFPFGVEETKKQVRDFMYGLKSMCDNMRVV